MGWFKRLKDGIQTATNNKMEAPEGIWYNCKRCKETNRVKVIRENFYKCPNCDYHIRIGSHDYFELIYDEQSYQELFVDLVPKDFLKFQDLKSYEDRIKQAQKRTDLDDSMTVAVGKVNKQPLVIAAMDFSFIGGSMGSVMGEKIALAIEYS
ncbi:MAG: acetyl-CoA carboxylase carboxyl transferase subunit beta, partial [Bacteroidota bacterium]